MTRIAIAGASGSIGRLIVEQVHALGGDPVALDRSHDIDLLTGQGLDAALTGVEAVVDASQVCSPLAEDPISPILTATDTLTSACRKHDVGRLVMLSINGITDPGLQAFPFYKARVQQEEAIAASGLRHTIVRSAQWFEFGLNPAGVTESDDKVVAQDWAIQPVAAASVARFLAEAALGQHGDGPVAIAGKQRMHLPELTERTLRHRGDERPVEVIAPPLPEMASGALYAPSYAVLLGPDLDTWLQQQEG